MTKKPSMRDTQCTALDFKNPLLSWRETSLDSWHGIPLRTDMNRLTEVVSLQLLDFDLV